jgi:sugar phosphate isomerase/epimerase
MIEFGFNLSDTLPLEQEIEFAQRHGFTFFQVWYDYRGFSFNNQRSNDVQLLNDSCFPMLIHAVVDIVEFEQEAEHLAENLKPLEITEVIIHPIVRKELSRVEIMDRLCHGAHDLIDRVFSKTLTIFFENNCRLVPVLHSVEDLKEFFTCVPRAEFLLDVAHMDNYDHLQQITNVRFPQILHIADRHLECVHEHLPIGQGNIDFERVFKSTLQDFEGRIVLEVPFNAEARQGSKQAIERILRTCA